MIETSGATFLRSDCFGRSSFLLESEHGEAGCLTGKSPERLSSPFEKILLFTSDPETPAYSPPSRPERGALAIVTNVGAGSGGRGSVVARGESQGGLSIE
jgi:hypothetical protein